MSPYRATARCTHIVTLLSCVKYRRVAWSYVLVLANDASSDNNNRGVHLVALVHLFRVQIVLSCRFIIIGSFVFVFI